MAEKTPGLLIQTSPFLRQGLTTPRVMADVLVALLPVLGVAVWYFGVGGLLVVAAATAGAVATEWLFGRRMAGVRLADGSAAVTGVVLGLTLPPGMPLWMAFLGGVVAIGLGKLVWGGLGHNLFNPALVGRAFLQAAFPIAITTWVAPAGWTAVWRSNFAPPFMRPAGDAVTSATPLNLMKFEGAETAPGALLVGDVAGSLGETSAGVILGVGAFLVLRRAFDWRIPVGIVASVALFSAVPWLLAPERYPSPLFMLLSGGLLFGAVFMATDPVTSPVAPLGAWIFASGVGLLVVLIRLWGGLPEGVMYAILLMNAATPLIERVTQPRAFGHRRRTEGAA